MMSFVTRWLVFLCDCKLLGRLLVLALFKLVILLFDNRLLLSERLEVSLKEEREVY